jgi:hypothetical protein
MTAEQYQQRKEQLLEQTFGKLSEELLEQWEPETRNAVLVRSYMEALKAEAERDPDFKALYFREVAQEQIEGYLQEHRPKGCYRADGLIPLSSERYKQMPCVTRADLLAWRELETDPANLAYIDSRFEVWPAGIESLGDLERALAD